MTSLPQPSPRFVGLLQPSLGHKAKCKVLPVGQGTPKLKHKVSDKRIESSPEEKVLGILVDEKLSMRQQCVLTAQQTSPILGCILPLCSMLLRPHLEECVQLCGLQLKKDMDLLQEVQRRVQG